MDDFLIGLFVTALALFLWAALGHLVWVIGAAAFRGIFGTRCPHCERKQMGSDSCTYCGRSLLSTPKADSVTPRNVLSQDIHGARRLLQYAKFRNWINDEQHESLKQTLTGLANKVTEDQTAQAEALTSTARLSDAETAALSSPPGVSDQSDTDQLPPIVITGDLAAAESRSAAGHVQKPGRSVSEDTESGAADVPPSRPQTRHPLDIDYTPPAATPNQPVLRQRLTADLLASFMEKTNIRWIEVISATLIVVCSTGLVISLWSTLSQTSRFFPSLVFLLATLAVHGAGQYTLRRWKLRTTSRGILHIGLLLIPLAVLVGILLARRPGQAPTLDAMTLFAIAVGSFVYGGLAVTASWALFGRRWHQVAVPNIVASISLLPVYFAGQRQLLDSSSAACILLPMLGVSLCQALAASRSTALASQLISGVARRIGGIVIQNLFPTLVVLIFWVIQARQTGPLAEGWWIATGLLAAAWTSWGWTASLSHFSKQPLASGRGYRRPASDLVRTSRVERDKESNDRRQPANAAVVAAGQARLAGWLAVTAWGIASIGTLLLILCLWQVGLARMPLAMLLIGIGIWWLLHGWLCDVRTSLAGGTVAVLLAVTIASEAAFTTEPILYPSAWISLPRIVTMTLLGAVALAIGTAGQRVAAGLSRRTASNQLSFFPNRRLHRASLHIIWWQVAIGAGVVVAAAAALTVLASLVPFGATPYGGNWAGLLLVLYGCLCTASSTAYCWWSSRSEVIGDGSPTPSLGASLPRDVSISLTGKLAPLLMPSGCALLLLGTVRLCQTSPMLDDLLGFLRPVSAWAIALAGLSVFWSVLAAIIRSLGWGRNNRHFDLQSYASPALTDSAAGKTSIATDATLPKLLASEQRAEVRFLCWGAVAVGLVSFLPIWSLARHLQLALYLGWYLPVTTACLFITIRKPFWREATLPALGLWVGGGLYYVGYTHGWWQHLNLTTVVALYVGVMVGLCVAFECLLLVAASWLSSRRMANGLARGAPNGSASHSELSKTLPFAESHDWLVAPPSWASALLLVAGWFGFSIAMLFSAAPILIEILGGKAITTASAAAEPGLAPEMGLPRFDGWHLLVLGFLAAATIWISRLHRQWQLALWLAGVPLLTALLSATWTAAPWALPATLWVLAAWWLAAECLPWLDKIAGNRIWGNAWKTNLEGLVNQDVASKSHSQEVPIWLSVGTAITFVTLLILTVMTLGAAASGALPDSLSLFSDSGSRTSGRRWLQLQLIGPLLSVLAVRWGISTWQADQSWMIGLSGILLSLLSGFALSGVCLTQVSWSDAGVWFLQGSALASGALAWLTMSVTALRNLAVLRHMSAGRAGLRQLLPKSFKGGRWQRSERAAQAINQFGLLPLVILCASATVLTVAYPAQRLSGIEQVGSWWTGGGILLLATLAWWLAIRRGASQFGLLALVLGLLAPWLATSYAAWLMADPSRAYPGAAGFEPYRALVCLWLAALAIGLTVRILVNRSRACLQAVLSPGLDQRERQATDRQTLSSLRTSPVFGLPVNASMLGEGLWIGLALATAGLSLVSIPHDPNALWPLSELSLLALLAVCSGDASGQAWRQHLAAVAAAAGLTVWLLEQNTAPVLERVWLVLWGPAWVAAVALLCRQTRFLQPHQALLTSGLAPSSTATEQSTASNATSAELSVRPGVWSRAADRLRSGLAVTVDQTVSLHLPIGSIVLCCVWILRESVEAIGTGMLPRSIGAATVWTWWVVGLTAASLGLAIYRLWDPRPGKRGVCVYLSMIALTCTGVLACCASGRLPLQQTWLLWIASGLGAMAIMAALLRELMRDASRLGAAFHIGAIRNAPAQFRHALTWMPAIHTVAAMAALLPTVLLVLGFEERTMRVAATVLPLIGSLAILPIAGGRGRRVLRYCGILLISATLVLLWWADLPSAWAIAASQDARGAATWIFAQRAFAALVTLSIAQAIAAEWLRDRSQDVASVTRGYETNKVEPATTGVGTAHGDWEIPLMRCSWISLGLAFMTGGGLLLFQFDERFGISWRDAAASAALGTKLLTVVAWAALVARLIQFAAWPHGTDRSAATSTRQAGVYIAELALAAMCAAAYFHFPQLFSGAFVDWWPLLVFGIAMLSAGIGQWLSRLGQSVIADPIRQSSLLLPVIPLAGVWWIHPESSALAWNDWSRYALLLLIAASLYGLHGWVHQSLRLKSLAAGLTLASFWAFLHSHPDWRFLEHPQFWLLPPALAMLLFVEVNRHRMESQVVIATRYTCVLTAYLSGTAEIFLKAFEGQLWQPLLLLVLALAGVAAGIALHIRAFLYCGSTFVIVALVGMVWHAQQAIGQVWPWWAFGIATGISLIAFLGYFEKNRPRALAYLEQIKQWEQ